MQLILKKYKTVVLSLLLCQILTAQDPTENIIPPSPEMASLGKYLDFPISTYTGQANVSIPIHTLQVGDIELPISLSYHTGGVRVGDISPWTGMGWSLNYGGFINRSVNGAPDGGGTTPFFPQLPTELSSWHTPIIFGLPEGKLYDSQHDFFHFQAGGYSGKFVLDSNNLYEPLLLPKQNISVALNDKTHFNSFTLRTPNGISYDFNEVESTEYTSHCTGGAVVNRSIYNSGWRISEINSLATDQFIKLDYRKELIEYENPPTYKDNTVINGSGVIKNVTCTSNSKVSNQLIINSIEGSDGTRVEFIAGPDRKDLPGSKMLSRIDIYWDNELIKSFDFTYKYLKGRFWYEINDPDIQPDTETLRLVLLSVQERVGTETKPPYVFEYHTDKGVPSRFSKSIDYWGYYNGISNSTLVPRMISGQKFYDGATRKPVLEYAKQGSLKKITYPTGGHTAYQYDLNQSDNISFNYYDTPQDIFDIHTIRQSDPNNTNTFTLGKSRASIFEISFSENGFCDATPCNVQLGLFKWDPTQNKYITIIAMHPQYDQETIDELKEQHNLVREITLSAGDYKLERIINDPDFSIDDYFIEIKWPKDQLDIEPTNSNKVGGLRIKNSTIYDPSSNKEIVNTYQYEGGQLSLSGLPVFGRSTVFINPTSDSPNCWTAESTVFQRSSSPNYSLSTTNGGIVGYKKVTLSQTGNGRTEYQYYTWEDHPDYILDGQINIPTINNSDTYTLYEFAQPVDFMAGTYDPPYPPIDSKDWKRGLLKSEMVYSENSTLLQRKDRKYRFFDDPSNANYNPSKIQVLQGFAANGENSYQCIETLPDGNIRRHQQGYMILYAYQLTSSWYELAEESTITFMENDTISQSVSYGNYNNQHLMPTEIITNDEETDVVIKNTLYPQDFSNGSYGSNVLRTNHILNRPLRTTTKNGSQETISKSETYYNNTSHGTAIMPYKTMLYPKGSPTDPIITDLRFNSEGKLLDVSDTHNRGNISYRWGYEHTLPVIKVENPDSRLNTVYQASSVLPDGYTSLEALVTNLDDIATNSAKQQLWKTYNENLRKHSFMQSSLITTYTYKPLIGITSVTDPKGYTMYYHYDELNRLELVKDAEGNLVSENKYNYKN